MPGVGLSFLEHSIMKARCCDMSHVTRRAEVLLLVFTPMRGEWLLRGRVVYIGYAKKFTSYEAR